MTLVSRDQSSDAGTEIIVEGGKIKNVSEVVKDPLVSKRILNAIDPVSGKKVTLAPPPNMTPFLEAGGQKMSFPPRFGEHNKDIYGGVLGYDDSSIAGFREKGVI